MAPSMSWDDSAQALLHGASPSRGRYATPYDAVTAVLSAAGPGTRDALHLRMLRRAAGTDGGVAGGPHLGEAYTEGERRLNAKMRYASLALVAEMAMAVLFLLLGLAARRSLLITIVLNPAQFLTGGIGLVGVARCDPFYVLVNILTTTLMVGVEIGTIFYENYEIGSEAAFGMTVWFSITSALHVFLLLFSLPVYSAYAAALREVRKERQAEAREVEDGARRLTLAAAGGLPATRSREAQEYVSGALPDQLPSTFSAKVELLIEGGREPPKYMIDPLLLQVMHDPVTTESGNTYERSAIEKWLQRNSTDPLTNARLTSKRLVPNNTLRSQIASWIDEGDGGGARSPRQIAAEGGRGAEAAEAAAEP